MVGARLHHFVKADMSKALVNKELPNLASQEAGVLEMSRFK
jgi:hypothetical protein